MKKTLAYDLYELYPVSDRSLRYSTIPIESERPCPTISMEKDRLIRFRNDYLILAEVVSEVLGKANFTLLDIVDWHHKRETYESGEKRAFGNDPAIGND